MTKLNIVIHEIWGGSLNLIQALIVLRESDLTSKGGDCCGSHADLEATGQKGWIKACSRPTMAQYFSSKYSRVFHDFSEHD